MTTSSVRHSGLHELRHSQVQLLEGVLKTAVEVHGRGNFPTLEFQLHEFLLSVRSQLERCGITVKELRLNGGAAAWVIGSDECDSLIYNDIDLVFVVELACERDLQQIKDSMLESLLQYLPHGINKNRLSCDSLKDAYVSKMKKVWTDNDRWSLLSLSNNNGKNIELKFVNRMKRQFEFSVDSFQIVLDDMLRYCASRGDADAPPAVLAESKYGDFDEACSHLHNKVIATVNPEEIRGGGLLKYCQLLARSFHTECSPHQRATMERTMCTRFFIDFPEGLQQYRKLDSYLGDHFGDNFNLMHAYLCELYRVVQSSSVCLMSQERQMVLGLIAWMCFYVCYEENRRNNCEDVELDIFKIGDGYVVDQIYYFGPNPYKGVTPTMQACCWYVPQTSTADSGVYLCPQYAAGPPSPN